MSTITSQLDAKASRIAEQVDDLGRETAENLHAAASSIRQGTKAIDELAGNTADKLDKAGSYVEKHTVKQAIVDSRRLVRQYPAQSLLVAAGAGFLAGVAVRRLTLAVLSAGSRSLDRIRSFGSA